ncbi:ribosome-inactivating family protein [Streptomyces sp. NPDC005426]|uniref:ribosome-inactivating family protein n=1 Tax=Streptomyces sp. NPDC005426 TaxID=3155344 RepID=UPI00339E8743
MADAKLGRANAFSRPDEADEGSLGQTVSVAEEILLSASAHSIPYPTERPVVKHIAATRKPLPRLAALMVSLLLALAWMLGGTSAVPAHADTPYGQISHVYMNFGPSAGASQQSQYTGLINSLRQAAGHTYRNGVYETQSTGYSLIRLTLTDSHMTLTLWLTPGDLYLRGYTTASGQTFQFNDHDFSLINLLSGIGDLPYGTGHTLSFGSNYNSMVQAANRGREDMPISYTDFFNSVYNLAYADSPYGGNQQDVARSLMLMVQLTSEAARFNDVFGVGSDIMGSWRNYTGLPLRQQYLENSWQRISSFGHSVSQDPSTAPVNITGVGTLQSWNDVLRYMATLLGNLNLPQEGPTGDWQKTEL